MMIKCPSCDREWPKNSEQYAAVVKRGECIVCIVEQGGRIQMDPYEFEVVFDTKRHPDLCQTTRTGN